MVPWETGKMSKSKGEFLTLDVLKEKGYDPMIYRLFCLNSHYRKTLLFSYEIMDDVKKTYEKIKRKIHQINNNKTGNIRKEEIKNYQIRFKEQLENDLNTANALTVLYEVIKTEELNNLEKITLIEEFDQILSLNLVEKEKKDIDLEMKQYIENMILKRSQAKQDKNYELADQIRNELLEKNITLIDTKDSTKYEIE